MEARKKCGYCDKTLKAKKESNLHNVERTHVLTSCSAATAENKTMWRNL